MAKGSKTLYEREIDRELEHDKTDHPARQHKKRKSGGKAAGHMAAQRHDRHARRQAGGPAPAMGPPAGGPAPAMPPGMGPPAGGFGAMPQPGGPAGSAAMGPAFRGPQMPGMGQQPGGFGQMPPGMAPPPAMPPGMGPAAGGALPQGGGPAGNIAMGPAFRGPQMPGMGAPTGGFGAMPQPGGPAGSAAMGPAASMQPPGMQRGGRARNGQKWIPGQGVEMNAPVESKSRGRSVLEG